MKRTIKIVNKEVTMGFNTSLGDIDLSLDLFKQEEYLSFSSICYFKTKDDLYLSLIHISEPTRP